MMKVPSLKIDLKNIERRKKHKKHRKQHHKKIQEIHPPILEQIDPEDEDPVTYYPLHEPTDATIVADTTSPQIEHLGETEFNPMADATKVSYESPAQNVSSCRANLSFLKMADNGDVKLNIITSSPTQPEDTNERVLNLEQLCGVLTSGIDALPSEIDEEECIETLHAKPVESLESGPFGSYLPTQDSTFANITKEQTENFLDVYGGSETCLQYARSSQDYAQGTNYVITMVDSLLGRLMKGEHGKKVVLIRKKEKLGEDGAEVQAVLDLIDQLLVSLEEVQVRRLSTCATPVEPGDEESRLADEILSKMTQLIKDETKPQDIADSVSIFTALGIKVNI